MENHMRKIKRAVSFLIALFMILTMLPVNFAYAATAPNVKNMKRTIMSKGNHYFVGVYNYSSYNQLPNDTGPVYRDPTNEVGDGDWKWDTIDGLRVVRPGETDNASMGFAIGLEEHKILGAAIKGQLTAYDSIYYDNYKGDDDYGRPFITFYNRNGNSLGTNWGDKHSVSNWIENNMSRSVPTNAAYVIFGAYGKRDGGLFNKDLDFNLNSIKGTVTDYTKPYVIKIENNYPHMSADDEIIKQNTQAQEPNLFITMSENCTFPGNMKVTLTADDNTTNTVSLEYLSEYNFDYSNGDVTYKFKIKVEELYNNNIKKHFSEVLVNPFTVSDTLGNSTYVTGLKCNKRIDTVPPEISNVGFSNVFKVTDKFGLSKITTTITSSSNISNTNSVLDVEKNKTTVKSAYKSSDELDAIKKGMLTIQNTTNLTDVFKVTIEASDLVYDTSSSYRLKNTTTIQRELFLISNLQPLRFSLENSNNALLDILPDDVNKNTQDALTNMYLKTNIDSKYLAYDSDSNTADPVVYYKWGLTYDENKLSEDPVSNNWSQVKFKNNSNETEFITIPVELRTDEDGEYLYPTYKDGGYLYIIPSIKDASTNDAQIRAGAVALKYNEEESLDTMGNKGFFKITSNPVSGKFVNRGCGCTGQGEEVDDISHYALTGNHKKDIGFNVTKNHEYLSNIKYFISRKNSANSYITQGSIVKNTTGEYDIPISSIMNITGDYTVKLVLYSNKGDVTVQEIPVSIESPIVGVSDIMYNQVTKDLDFTVTYAKNSIVNGILSDIQIEFGNGNIVEFQDELEDNMSLYAISENGVIPKENWPAEIGEKAFVRTEFNPTDKDPNLMTANFRASLSNMEISGDKFIQAAGEKRVHLKYTTGNKVEVFNNNITVIKKSNIPPSINKIEGNEGAYLTGEEFNNSENPYIKVKIEEPIVDLTKVHYAWVGRADDSLIQNDSTVGGNPVAFVGDVVELSPRDIPLVSGDELLKTYYLAIYAENSAGKFVEKTFGPFYVLNKQINDKRFEITATEKAVDDNHVFIAVDDKLHMINELAKPDKIKVLWQKDNLNIAKEYDISFEKNEATTNVAYVNVPYIDLIDTDGIGGTFILKTVSIYNSSDESLVFKEFYTDTIKQTLTEHFVTITMLSNSNDDYGANVMSDADEIEFKWSLNPYEISSVWVTTKGAITGVDFVPEEKESLIYSRIYLFLKVWNNIYKTDEIKLQNNDVSEAINVTSIKIGEAETGYYGPENGSKEDTLIRIRLNSSDLSKITNVQYYDNFSVTSMTAITINNMYKISDNEVAGLLPTVVTSGGAISCKITINGFEADDVVSPCVGNLPSDKTVFTRDNRTITIENTTEHLIYTLYQNDGSAYVFDENGKTEIYEAGNYVLVYRSGSNVFAKEVKIVEVTYNAEDIMTTLDPVKPVEGKVSGPVNASIIMPRGSLINDKYGIINNVYTDGNKTVAAALITKSAIYSFDIKFANNQVLENYEMNIDYINEDYIPILEEVTSSSAITFNPTGPNLTIEDVTASIGEGYSVLNNNRNKTVTFDKNGTFSFILKDTENNIKLYTSLVNWIDKKCPEPVIRKYVWYDFDSDGNVDDGEKGVEIPQGYKTKNNVLAEITFPHNIATDRPVKLSDATGFTILDSSEIEGYAYKFVFAYNPPITADTTPDYRKALIFTDTLGNNLSYNFEIDEIDRTDLLTQLNYSTTYYTNRDVVVSMSANRPVKRFDIVDGIEKDASPTYVFKENGTKDFNYRQIEVADDPLEGKLTANVTWIDKSVPMVKAEYDNTLTNNDVEIELTVINGVMEDARLMYGNSLISLTDSGNDKVGTYTVNENGNYRFTVSNKYGNIGETIVPVYNIDKEKPSLSIKGREHVYVKAGDKYYDQGATAIDNNDGDITSGIRVENNVNTSLAASDPYEVIYKVTDSAGNTSTKTRYVHVLNIESAVAIVQDNVIDLRSQDVTKIKLSESGMVYTEFVGIDGNFKVKYSKGEGYDNAYFKVNGSYMSKLGTFTAQEGIYTLYVQDQERNTRIIKLDFYK